MQGKHGNAMDPQTFESADCSQNPNSWSEIGPIKSCYKTSHGTHVSLWLQKNKFWVRTLPFPNHGLEAFPVARHVRCGRKIWKVRSREQSSWMGLGTVEGGVERYGGG